MTSTPQEQTNEASPPPSEEPVGGTKASAPPTTCARPPYYSRHKLLFLTKSPLVAPPSDMPPLKDWFGDWNEQQPARKDVDSNGTARTRYRNHADDSEQPPRESTSRPTRPTFSQATQMGNFRHQSIKLDLHDRDNSLRSLSDKFDRDRTLRSGEGLGSGTSSNTLSLPQSSRRDAGPHLSGRQSTTSLSSTGTSATRKTNNDRDRDSSYRGEANGRRGANGPEGRGERSDDWRRGGLKDDWETRDRDRPNERERTRDRDRRSRSRDPKRDDRRDKDDARKDSDHSGWTVATGDRDRRRNARERDRDRDEEEGTGRERTGRRAADREREKEKEPAWMEDYVPDSTSKSSGKGFGLLAAEGGLDGLQAWKKEMMEKEKERDSQKEKPIMNPLVNDLAPPETSPTNGLNDIEKFKLAMKESLAQKEKALGKSPTDTVVVADGPPPGLQPVADQSSVKADPAIIQSQLPADPAIINSSTPIPSLPTTTAVSTAIIGNEAPTVGSISLKSLGFAPADDVATSSRMAHPPNDTSQDAAFAFKNLIMPSSTPPIQPVSPNHARTGSTDPTRLLSNPVTPLPNSPSTVDTRSSSRNALGRDSLGEFGKPLNSAAIFEASAVVNPPPTASAMGRSKFAKFFQSQDRDSAAGVNPRTPTNSISGPNPSLPVQNHDPLLSLAGNGPIGGQPLMNPSPSNLSMVDSVNGQNILNPLAQGPNALSGLLANLNMNGAASVNKGVDRNQAVGVPTGGSIEGIFAALAASKPSGNRPPSGAGFGQAPKIPQSQSPHHFGTQHQLHPQQLQMPHIPPPNTQLPFNPSSQNDLTDGGKFVPNGMVPGLGPPRRDSTISGGSDLDERDRYGFNLQRLPPQAQQQLFEQQQLNQLRSVPQPMYPNQGPNRNGMNVMPPQFRHGPSPIGNQNPTSNGSQHQRGMSSMGGIIRPNPQELVGNGGGAGIVGMGLPVMRGMGSGIGPDVIRGPHELGLRGGPQDLNGIPGIMRSPSDVPGPFGMAQQQFGGPQQLPGQQNSLPPNHILTGPTAGGPVRVGPPGSADFVLHTQQLQAARAAAAAQQQQQMMQHLGLGLRHPNPQSVQQPQQLRPGLPQHILPHNVNQQQQLGGLNQVGISQLHPNDFGGSGFPPHANHVGGIGPNAPGAGAEAFLQLFMNGSGQRE